VAVSSVEARYSRQGLSRRAAQQTGEQRSSNGHGRRGGRALGGCWGGAAWQCEPDSLLDSSAPLPQAYRGLKVGGSLFSGSPDRVEAQLDAAPFRHEFFGRGEIPTISRSGYRRFIGANDLSPSLPNRIQPGPELMGHSQGAQQPQLGV